MQVGVLTRAAFVAGAGGGLLILLLDCTSFDSTSDPPTSADASDATSLVDASGPSPDAEPTQDASEDGACEGAFIDDFDRPNPAGGPWDQYGAELGDAGFAGVHTVDGGGKALSIAFPVNGQDARYAFLSKTFPEKTRFVDVAFKQNFYVANDGTPDWAASLVTFETVEPGATVSQGFALFSNATAKLVAGRQLDDGGAPNYSSAPVALLGEHDVRLTATFGAGGGIVSVVDGVTTTIPFATVPASRSLRLGLAISGSGAPDLAVEYRKVSVCWR